MNQIYFFLFLLLIITFSLQAQNVGIGESAPAAKFEVKGDNGSDLFNVKDDADNSRLYVTEAGNVGIGTTNPSGLLNVVGANSSSSAGIIEIDAGGSANLRMGVNTGYSWIQSHGGLPLYINELGNDVILSQGGIGNVGIGTTSPTRALDIDGRIRIRQGATNNHVLTSDVNGNATWQDPNTLVNGDDWGNQSVQTGSSLIGDGTSGSVLDVSWSDANDLDANGNVQNSDQLDGQHGSYYLNWNNFTNVPSGLNDGDDDNQTLSINNDYNLNISNGNSVTLEHLHVTDTRDDNNPPTFYDKEVAFDFKRRSTVGVPGSGTYSGHMTIAPWGDNSGDAHHQVNLNEGGIFWRQGQPNASSWGNWQEIWTEATDGSGSGLDADMVDGQHWSDIQNWVNANDDNTTYSAGNDLNLSGTTFSLENDINVNDIRATSGSSIQMHDHLDITNHRMTNLADPVNDQDAVNKRFLKNRFWDKNTFSFTVGGNDGQFYPVLINVDGERNAPVTFTIHRSNVHENSGSWNSTFSAEIKFWARRFGHTPISYTIDYYRGKGDHPAPLAKVDDGSMGSGNAQMVLWLTGGLTYHVFSHNGDVNLDDANTSGGPVTDNSGNTHNPTSTRELDADYVHFLDQGITTEGNVGIGTTSPSTALEVSGRIQSNGINETSDERFKKNINAIDDAIGKVNRMQGVFYEWRQSEYPKRNFDDGRQAGVIAQEVEKVLPEVVHTDDKGYKSVDYSHLTPLLIEAVKELSNENRELRSRLQRIEAKLGIDQPSQSNEVRATAGQ